MYCPNCGKEIKPGQKFCVGCGTKANLNSADSVQESESKEIKDLVERAKSGDESAFQALYEKTNKRNYYVALKMVKTDADAQDVLQDAYIRIYQHLDQYTYNGESSFASWSSKIVSNTALNHLRKKQAVLFSDIEGDQEGDFTLEIEDEDESRQPELAYDKKETSQIVQELLGTLSDEQRVCAMMFYYQEQSVKEIASEIGCSENTVKSRLNYARKNMMSKAEELKKRGILTGILSMAALFAILRSNEAMAMEHIPESVYAGISSGINGNIGAATTTITEGTSAGSSVVGSSSAMASGVATSSGAATGVAVSTGLGLKIAIAVLGAVALITAGIATTLVITKNSEPSKIESEVDKPDGEVEKPASSGSSANVDENNNANMDDKTKLLNEFADQYEYLTQYHDELSMELTRNVDSEGIGKNADVSYSDRVFSNPLSYAIKDFDKDSEQELMILEVEKTKPKSELYSKSSKTPKLVVKMYEVVGDKVEMVDQVSEFGDVIFSGGMEGLGGSFASFTFEYKGKQIIAFQEIMGDISSLFADGGGNTRFAALTYDGSKLNVMKESVLEFWSTGGDESFDYHKKWYSFYDEKAMKMRIKEFSCVGIKLTTGDLINTDKTPYNTVKSVETILKVKNENSQYNTEENDYKYLLTFESGFTSSGISIDTIQNAYKEYFEGRKGEVSVEGVDAKAGSGFKNVSLSFNQLDEYKLFDIDGDEIPEMFMCDKLEMEDSREFLVVFSYNDGKITPLFAYKGYDDAAISEVTHTGNSGICVETFDGNYYYIKYDNGKMISDVTVTRSEDEDYEYHFQGVYSDGRKMSESEADQYMSSNTGRWIIS